MNCLTRLTGHTATGLKKSSIPILYPLIAEEPAPKTEDGGLTT